MPIKSRGDTSSIDDRATEEAHAEFGKLIEAHAMNVHRLLRSVSSAGDGAAGDRTLLAGRRWRRRIFEVEDGTTSFLERLQFGPSLRNGRVVHGYDAAFPMKFQPEAVLE